MLHGHFAGANISIHAPWINYFSIADKTIQRISATGLAKKKRYSQISVPLPDMHAGLFPFEDFGFAC
jgi:hypothetical protein